MEKITFKYFLPEALIFILSLFLGILAALELQAFYLLNDITVGVASPLDFVLQFVLATGILLFIIYFFRKKKVKKVFFKVIFFFALLFGNLYFLGLFLPPLVVFLWLVFLCVFLIKKPSLFIHNTGLVFAICGIGAGLGTQLNPLAVVVLLALFSIYDFIAVYKTKHMVKMAEEMLQSRAIMGFIIPKKLSELKAEPKEIKPGGKFLVLGAGDIVFPLMLTCSVVSTGLLEAIVVGVFSFLGLLFSFFLFSSKKKRTPMPALPPIALLSIIGYFVTMLI